MTDRRIGPSVTVEVPLSQDRTRLLVRNLRSNPNNDKDVGNVTTRRGVLVWRIEQRLRRSSRRRLIASRFGISMRELRAAHLWAELCEDDIDRCIEISRHTAGY